ncbi:type IV toxin-antitoxin system AbiEi family antitoxin domain-containing protein [Pedobacter sp. JCM 36344]|uniref:type IV toxin-antitoxin system AbiEi family antitoxin domain-containing protein n=1 Tax=Pedobacter sp. JCM 36344 TaxID=3374280 RepID=UPI00397BFA09
MEIRTALRELSNQPLTHQLLVNLLKDYKRPNDKILSLKADGLIEPIKKGLYIVGRSLGSERPESALLANHIFGPSYLSMESALAHYGLIPEKVFAVTSMATKASRKFQANIGLYTYTNLPLPYFAFGLATISLSKDQRAIMAIPEKALCDKIATTAGITLRSQSSARDYVFGNLRMEEEDLAKFDLNAMLSWLENAPKRESLEMLIKMIEKI